MKFRLFAPLFYAVLLHGCTQELPETTAQSLDGKTILTARVSEATKAAFDNDGTFSWSEGDAISVYTSYATFRSFDMISGAGGPSATFAGTLGDGETAEQIAVYPYNSGHALSGKSLTVVLPDTYTWSSDGNARTPMISLLEGGSNALSFKHIGGILRVTFADVPAETRQFVFTAPGRKVSGSFTLSDYTAADAAITTADSSEGNSLTILTPAPQSTMAFFIPLPVGSYNGFQVQLQDEAGNPLIVRTRESAFTVARKGYTRMGTIDGAAFTGKKMLFDFGHKNDGNCPATTSPDANGNYWNNIEKTGSGQNGQGLSFDLSYTDGSASAYQLSLVTSFWSNGAANGGLTQAKWSSTTATSLGDLAVGTATQDYFFAQGENTVCTFRLSGLDATRGYKFYFFGSRSATANNQSREAKYSVEGYNSFEGLLLITGPNNGDQNKDNLLVSDIIYPKAGGTIDVSLSKGSNSQTSNHYYQLNCMKVEEYEGGVLPVQNPHYDYTALEVTSAEETFLMHKANVDGNIFEGVSTFAAGEVSMTGTTTGNEAIPLTATSTVDGLAYFTADLDNQVFTFQAVTEVVAEGTALNGWSTTNGASLPYKGHGVFGGENLVFAGSGLTTAKAVSDPSRFNFVFRGAWNPTFKRVDGTRRAVEASSYGTSGDIQVNPGTYDVTLNLRDFTFDIAPSAIDPDRITVMGSSVPRGYSATDYHGYIFMYDDILKARGSDWYVSNISVAGNNTLNLLNRYDELVTDGGSYVIYALSLGNEGIHEASDKETVYNQWKTNMQTLISQARADGKTVVVTGNYARADFTAADYDAVKRMNLEIHEWDLPSVNLLGAIDNGAGRWATGYDAGDTYHPNNAGHVEMSYTMVPSLFDALKAGKALPVRSTAGSYALSGRQVITVAPEGAIHPFTVSFGIRTSSPGSILTFFDGENARSVQVSAAGVLTYQGITGATAVNDNAWHQVTLTHFYARGETLLYVDGTLQGSVSEKLTTSAFHIGYADADQSASFREIFFWRSGMNAEEMAALQAGKMLKSSLEFYAPLGGSLENLAQSTSVLTLSDGATLVPAEDTTPRLNGEPLTSGSGSLTATKIALTQGGTLSFTNAPSLDGCWVDPDFFYWDSGALKFNAVDGYYQIVFYTGDDKYLTAQRLNEDGTKPNLSQGGLYVAGYGIAAYKMVNEIGWSGSNMYQLAQVSPGVFQITGVAVPERDPNVPGGKFRYDYWSVKYYFQSGWGGEASSGVSFSGNAAALLTQTSGGNLNLVDPKLEEGATYRLTVDFTGCTISGNALSAGKETIAFNKL